jgi:hypothetical protein
VRQHGLIAAFGKKFDCFIEGFMQLCLGMGEELMKIKLTPEMVRNVGKEWRDLVISTSTPEERLMGLRPEERLMGLGPEERLMGLKPEEIISKYGKEKILSGMTEKEIEAYLKKLKKSKRRKKSDL